MTAFELRRADENDVAAIRALVLRAYAKWVPITPRKPLPMTADYDERITTHHFDCFWSGDAMAALIETFALGDELTIENIAVDPDFQGQGLGVRLMHHAEGLAREAGLSGTRLCTNKLMAENIALYERLGYVFEKETLHHGVTVAVHMTRALEV